jgi:hypothetical protein
MKNLNKRRYYLHSKLKKVIRLNSKARTIGVTETKIDSLTVIQSKYIGELQGRFNYSVQYEIE